MKGRLKRRVTRVDVITVTSEIIFLCVLSFLSFCYMAPPRCALSITMNVHAVTPPARLYSYGKAVHDKNRSRFAFLFYTIDLRSLQWLVSAHGARSSHSSLGECRSVRIRVELVEPRPCALPPRRVTAVRRRRSPAPVLQSPLAARTRRDELSHGSPGAVALR